MKDAIADVEKQMGREVRRQSTKPLLVSVRSGAKFSMPGMMDTVLNLGLNPTTIEALIKETGQRAVRLRLLPPLHHDAVAMWRSA